ncbi:MAG: hypothetical protein JWQ52_1386, partial [Phenylobacterium sp.]|nr:hypothetical protein [Phenylobacterium sp.]
MVRVTPRSAIPAWKSRPSPALRTLPPRQPLEMPVQSL